MKRATKKVEKRTFTLKNAIPRFVSIVNRGANLTPLAEVRMSDTAKFSEVEINRIVFSKDSYSLETVEAYLQENDYEDYEIVENADSFEVPGVDAELFADLSPIDYGDGVQFFVGKLKEPEVSEQPAATVKQSEVLEFASTLTQPGVNPKANGTTATPSAAAITSNPAQKGQDGNKVPRVGKNKANKNTATADGDAVAESPENNHQDELGSGASSLTSENSEKPAPIGGATGATGAEGITSPAPNEQEDLAGAGKKQKAKKKEVGTKIQAGDPAPGGAGESAQPDQAGSKKKKKKAPAEQEQTDQYANIVNDPDDEDDYDDENTETDEPKEEEFEEDDEQEDEDHDEDDVALPLEARPVNDQWSQEKVDAFVAAAVAKALEQFSAKLDETVEARVQEKLAEEKNKFSQQNKVDETEVVVQNSKVVQTEVISEQTNSKVEKFSHRRYNDLFGLRG